MNTVLAAALVVLLSPPATRLEDLERFPPLWAAEGNCLFQVEHRQWIDKQLEACWCEECRAHYAGWSREQFALWWLWDSLRYAADPQRDLPTRMRWLEEVRMILGEADWLAGRMPEPVPAWRFHERH